MGRTIKQKAHRAVGSDEQEGRRLTAQLRQAQQGHELRSEEDSGGWGWGTGGHSHTQQPYAQKQARGRKEVDRKQQQLQGKPRLTNRVGRVGEGEGKAHLRVEGLLKRFGVGQEYLQVCESTLWELGGEEERSRAGDQETASSKKDRVRTMRKTTEAEGKRENHVVCIYRIWRVTNGYTQGQVDDAKISRLGQPKECLWP